VSSDESMPPGNDAVSQQTGEKETGNAAAGPGPEPFELLITDVLDLHAFLPKEIPAVVETYLDEARRKGFATVRIIHGKGIGVQRERVHSVLRRTPFVARFQDAPGEAGGWGATIVWLKQPPADEGEADA
jgi:dsDNA-specific endonuclease/ATPase MutS2